MIQNIAGLNDSEQVCQINLLEYGPEGMCGSTRGQYQHRVELHGTIRSPLTTDNNGSVYSIRAHSVLYVVQKPFFRYRK